MHIEMIIFRLIVTGELWVSFVSYLDKSDHEISGVYSSPLGNINQIWHHSNKCGKLSNYLHVGRFFNKRLPDRLQTWGL